jgi:hypothetical protein
LREKMGVLTLAELVKVYEVLRHAMANDATT